MIFRGKRYADTGYYCGRSIKLQRSVEEIENEKLQRPIAEMSGTKLLQFVIELENEKLYQSGKEILHQIGGENSNKLLEI